MRGGIIGSLNCTTVLNGGATALLVEVAAMSFGRGGD